MENETDIKKSVRESYGKIAVNEGSCCGSDQSQCGDGPDVQEVDSRSIGYTDDQIKSVPEGSNLGLGCGNPTAFSSIKEGETILDLGSGAGFDCFLASEKTGKSGRVIGVDMTVEMIDKARQNMLKGNYKNVEFRLGEVENIPVQNNHIDLIISNCVINLSPDKQRVFQEAFKVLKPNGRIMVSDMVLQGDLPDEVRKSAAAYAGCISGAIRESEYLEKIKTAGFIDVKVVERTKPASIDREGALKPGTMSNRSKSETETRDAFHDTALQVSVSSIMVSARKPNKFLL